MWFMLSCITLIVVASAWFVIRESSIELFD